MNEPQQPAAAEPLPPIEELIPEGILQSCAALRRDLPQLLASWWTRGKWVCYHRDERVGVSRDYIKLVREVNRRNIPEDEFIIERIAPGAGSIEEEEIDSFGV